MSYVRRIPITNMLPLRHSVVRNARLPLGIDGIMADIGDGFIASLWSMCQWSNIPWSTARRIMSRATRRPQASSSM